MQKEIWKAIPGYNGVYWVSNQGRIKNAKTGRILRPGTCGRRGNYLQVGLMKDGKRKWHRVHGLVWLTFKGPVPEGYEINHINQDVKDNRLENLNLLTRLENIRWGDGIERRARAHSKKIYQYDLEGNLVRIWESAKYIKAETGWSKGQIRNCCRGASHYNTAHGFVWRYAE